MSDERWVDKMGDVWSLGDDGLMHARETAPFPREYVEKKWGPLRLCVAAPDAPVAAVPGEGR